MERKEKACVRVQFWVQSFSVAQIQVVPFVIAAPEDLFG